MKDSVNQYQHNYIEDIPEVVDTHYRNKNAMAIFSQIHDSTCLCLMVEEVLEKQIFKNTERTNFFSFVFIILLSLLIT